MEDWVDGVDEDGSEDLEEAEDGENPYLAMLTPEVKEKMLASIRANGIIV